MSSFVSFGIYFGNSSCSLAVNRDGNVDVVANASGDRVTPAIVGFQDSDVVVGTAAKLGLVRHHKCSITGCLRAIGSTKEDDIKFPLDLSCQILYDTKKPKFAIQSGDKSRMVNPEEVIKHLFVLLKEIADSHSSNERLPVVIALPAWVSDAAMSVVNHSATLAGFDILSTISQPAAACLAYKLLDDIEQNLNVVILHCGGTSLVVSVVEISSGFLNIRETSTSFSAGDSLTSCLVNYLAKEFLMKYKGDPLEAKRSHRKLYNVSENCKHVLSTVGTSQVYAESLWEGVDFTTQMSRARFEGLVSSKLNEFTTSILETLQRCNLDRAHVHKVILTGGSCKIPRLQKVVSDALPNAQVLKHVYPDESLVVGAAIESSFYSIAQSKKSRNTNLSLSRVSAPIWAKLSDSSESWCVFNVGTPAPSRQSKCFECSSTSSNLIIFESDEQPSSEPEEKQIIAEIQLNLIDAGNVKVDFHLKNDTNIMVKVTDPTTKATKCFTIESERMEL